MMVELRGTALLATITTLTSLGFLMIGYDNGLLVGLVNNDALNKTFNTPGQTMIGTIVSIFDVGAFHGAVATSFLARSSANDE
ncbi:hypothetical protein N7G274_010853 [Stereocaulon virgatum]|uniref:Major facilitator superfamily (MFS) profile domain-containing protein n=1 Tax=Stereocaulon virgatum TaxID=373712 RepID=A0ABR3ZTS2_9LECA